MAIDRADAVEWLDARLAESTPGLATVVYHSYFWQYLSAEDDAAGRAVIEQAGRRATEAAPFAHLALEVPPSGDYAHSELRLQLWPGGRERLLGTCVVHPVTVEWLG